MAPSVVNVRWVMYLMGLVVVALMTTSVSSEMFAEMELVQMWKVDLNVLVKTATPLEPCRPVKMLMSVMNSGISAPSDATMLKDLSGAFAPMGIPWHQMGGTAKM